MIHTDTLQVPNDIARFMVGLRDSPTSTKVVEDLFEYLDSSEVDVLKYALGYIST